MITIAKSADRERRTPPLLLFCPKGENVSFKESEHPRDADGKFTDGKSKGKEKSLEEIAKEIFPHLRRKEKQEAVSAGLTKEKNDAITYGDPIVRGVGARSPSYPIVYYPGTNIQVEFVPGTGPVYPPDHIIAGKGCKTKNPIDDIDRLVEEYHCDAAGWKKDKAIYEVYDEYGVIRKVELHWYHHDDVGKVEYKIKTRGGFVYLDEQGD